MNLLFQGKIRCDRQLILLFLDKKMKKNRKIAIFCTNKLLTTNAYIERR